MAYFSQIDERWKNEPYGSDKIGTHACGPTAMSIVVSSLSDETVDPPHMAHVVKAFGGMLWDNGGYCVGNGSYHSLIPNAAKAWGLSCEGDLSAQGIVDALSSGHFIVLRGVPSEGKILVVDCHRGSLPASVKRSNQEWDLSLIMNEAHRGAAAGGPYWAVGAP